MAETTWDYETAMATEPLWVTAMMAGDSTPGRRRDAFAAELRVIADWLLPEERMRLPPVAGAGEYHRWCERLRLRKLLLAEIEKAEETDGAD